MASSLKCEHDLSRVADAVLAPLLEVGHQSYGEGVTVMAHSLQAAAMAERAQESDAVVVAALMHDVGHGMAGDQQKYLAMLDEGRDNRHEEAGARFLLSMSLPREVSEPVRLHVSAKRYLVAKEPNYEISAMSAASLRVQGGPMDGDEMEEFEKNPFYREAVKVRRYDDKAKDPHAQTPNIEHFRKILIRYLRNMQ